MPVNLEAASALRESVFVVYSATLINTGRSAGGGFTGSTITYMVIRASRNRLNPTSHIGGRLENPSREEYGQGWLMVTQCLANARHQY